QSICGWQIINNLLVKSDYYIKIQELYEDFPSLQSNISLKSISNNELVVIKSDQNKVYKIFSLATMKEIQLKLHCDDTNYDSPSYIFNNYGDLAIYMPMTSFNKIYITIFIFYVKNLYDNCWMNKESINCKVIGEIRACLGLPISCKESSIFLMTALHCLLYVCKLLIIYLSPFTSQRMQYLYLSKYETKKILSHVNFISSDAGERLLLFFENITEIRDLDYLDHIIKEQNLCEKFFSKLNSKVNAQKADLYLISNGRIFSALEGSQITNFLQGILNENINIKDNKFINYEFRNKEIEKSYNGFLVKWEMGEKREIHPKHLKGHKFVYRCELLDNEDLIMITDVGLLIWTIWQRKEFRLQYYKGFTFKSEYLKLKDYKNQYITGTNVNKESKYKKLEFLAKKPYIKMLLEKI
ncbi:26199_t:CDS:2, partial [Gigaspora margarita]